MPNRIKHIFLQFRKTRTILFCQQTQLSTPPQSRTITTRLEPSSVKYKFADEVERLDYYVPGGYHPVKVGDKLSSGRYAIAHKLGFGQSSTTWLAEDTKKRRLVALKISTAQSAERAHEMLILSRLARSKSVLPGKAIVQNILDSFTFSGPNGTHRCLVTDAARIDMFEAKEASYRRPFRLPAVRAITAQLILGLQFIHSEGIIHGDLHLANILLRLPPDMQNMNVEQLHSRTGDPAKEQVIREDGAPLDPGVPSEAIVPVWLGLGSDEISVAESAIIIADFGEAFDPRERQHFTCHTPLLLAPPESRFAGPDEPLSFPGDIWTLACTIWDIFGSAPPFEDFPVSLDGITIEHVEMLGKLPDRWWSKWEERGNWFDEDGRKNVKEDLQRYYGSTAISWDQRFMWSIKRPRERRKLGTFSEEEENAFREMIKSMLVFEPSQRTTINEVVGCEWMQRWGLPEVQALLKSS